MPTQKKLRLAIDWTKKLSTGLKRSVDQFLILPKHVKEARLSKEQKDRLVAALRKVNYGLIDQIQ